ncbi:hypothetical protein [Cypionkella sp.]|uniref:hypothetical protein n=1 Tax=Cypionkella sp. TaxID=2811411 RepID=UPI002721CFFF|nr:hypothetical protein [Cypionkella sp.]MDO8986057.1 hypothetical protein [Cypionkella sp.]MDP2051974.1 hypothetical protein [Cypionkella sp.]
MSVRQAVPQGNPFLTAPIGRLFLSIALPMAVVMSMGGILNVVDGVFVGRFIGAEALAAVSLAFPAVMLMSALAILRAAACQARWRDLWAREIASRRPGSLPGRMVWRC